MFYSLAYSKTVTLNLSLIQFNLFDNSFNGHKNCSTVTYVCICTTENNLN